MTEDRVPTTEAGRSFLRWMADREHWHPIDGRRDVTTGYVVAIEREASEQPATPLDLCPDCHRTAYDIGMFHIRAQRARLGSAPSRSEPE